MCQATGFGYALCINVCLGLPDAGARARPGLIVGALVNNISDCMCYGRFDVDCSCFLIIYAFECSSWFYR